MFDLIEKFLIRYDIKNKTIIIGFSSGPDSVFLANAIYKLKNKFNLNIVLAYFNHGWREDANKDEEYTKEFAKKINSQFVIGKAPKEYKKDEETARDLRYTFFKDCANKFSTDIVLLAHNKNDNIETIIYRIIKGTSIKGLCGIPEQRDIYYRPLLNISKKEILDYLDKENLKYLIDSSNSDTKYKRNYIRQKILPLFEEINPKYIESINNLILNSSQSQNIIDSYIFNLKNNISDKDRLIYSKYVDLNLEYRLEILNNFIGCYLKYRNRKNLLMYDKFILENKHSRISLNSKYFLRTRYKRIFIEEAKNE